MHWGLWELQGWVQAPSGEKRGGRRIGVQHLMPGLGCGAPSPASLPFSVLPWPPWGPHQPRVQVSCSPIRFLGQHPGFLALCQELFSWHSASSPTVMGPLPLPDSCLSSSSLHLQGLAGCCPQQAGEAGQGRRETLGLESDTPARPSSLGQVPLPQFPLCNTLYTMPGAG